MGGGAGRNDEWGLREGRDQLKIGALASAQVELTVDGRSLVEAAAAGAHLSDDAIAAGAPADLLVTRVVGDAGLSGKRSLVSALGSYLGDDGFARCAEKRGGEERLTCTALIQGLHSEEHLPPEV